MRKDDEPIRFPNARYIKPHLVEPVRVLPIANIGISEEEAAGLVLLAKKRREKVLAMRFRHILESVAVGVVGSGADQMISRYLSGNTQTYNDHIFGPVILGGITIAGFIAAMRRR